MFGHSDKLYMVYENPTIAERSARVELVREGFSLWALVFGPFWFLAQKIWLPAVGYIAVAVLIARAGQWLGASELVRDLLQFGLQWLMAIFAHDIKAWQLTRRGYRLRHVVMADSSLRGLQRAYAAIG